MSSFYSSLSLLSYEVTLEYKFCTCYCLPQICVELLGCWQGASVSFFCIPSWDREASSVLYNMVIT